MFNPEDTIEPDALWAFHCNATMMAVDAGAFVVDANVCCANMLKILYDVDIKQHPQWKNCDLDQLETIIMGLYAKSIQAVGHLMQPENLDKIQVMLIQATDRLRVLTSGASTTIVQIAYPDVYHALSMIDDPNVLTTIINRCLYVLNQHRVDELRKFVKASGQ